MIPQVLHIRHMTYNTTISAALIRLRRTRVSCAAQIPPACFAGMTLVWDLVYDAAGHSPPFSAALGDLLRVALIAPGPGPAATTPPWGDAASPVGPGYTFLADDSSLTGQRAAGALFTHPEIPQRLPPPSMSGVSLPLSP